LQPQHLQSPLRFHVPYSWTSTVAADNCVSGVVLKNLSVAEAEGIAASMGHDSNSALPVAEEGEGFFFGLSLAKVQEAAASITQLSGAYRRAAE
jgi:hypothetical protein